jgi:biofilm PGA synthesis N-glycosyltransferase PgaC
LITDPLFLTITFSVFSLFYFIVLMSIYYGLKQLRMVQGEEKPFVSIVIAARNESRRITPCLQSLTKLDYPEESYEVIFVDDDSQDDTSVKIKNYCQARSNWHLLRIDEKSSILHGKKNALMKGIEKARGELIFTTDADCVVPAQWLHRMVPYFKPDVTMVLGYSPLMKKQGLLFSILSFDNLFSAIVSAAPVKLGHPFNSVGRNLAYRKRAYENAGGFLALKAFRSGDDIHLTQRFRDLKSGKIDFCAHPDTFVQTFLPSTFSEIFHQQLRKNSKTTKLPWPSLFFIFLVFIYYILLVIVPLLSSQLLFFWLILLAIKFTLEYLNLHKAAHIFRQKHLIPLIPVMQVIYPLYLIIFNLLGIFQKYNWKQ